MNLTDTTVAMLNLNISWPSQMDTKIDHYIWTLGFLFSMIYQFALLNQVDG